MSVQMVLLPVFVLVGLTFALLLWMASADRRGARETSQGYRARQPNWPPATQIGNCFANQFETARSCSTS